MSCCGFLIFFLFLNYNNYDIHGDSDILFYSPEIISSHNVITQPRFNVNEFDTIGNRKLPERSPLSTFHYLRILFKDIRYDYEMVSILYIKPWVLLHLNNDLH